MNSLLWQEKFLGLSNTGVEASQHTGNSTPLFSFQQQEKKNQLVSGSELDLSTGGWRNYRFLKILVLLVL